MKKRIGLTHSALIAAIACLFAGAMYGGLFAHAMCWQCWSSQNTRTETVGLYDPTSEGGLKYEQVFFCSKCDRYWRPGSPWKKPWPTSFNF